VNAVTRETPASATAADAHALRFGGAAGRYLLAEQDAAIRAVLADWRGGNVLEVAGATAPGDLPDLPFESRSFDAVVAAELLPHVRNWPRLISELCRVARSTVVVDYPRPSRRSGLTRLLLPLDKQERGARVYRNFRDAEIDELLRACGFETRRRRRVFGSPVVVRAERWRS
jgi:hypothetical protein